MPSSEHVILRRWRDPRSEGGLYRADCSCGLHITGPDSEWRDESVRVHLEEPDYAQQ